ncbi:MAG: hypothetical protein DRN81_04060 [Thermoproteota archaeon]|nr:MAG: hypothetical protein DRN81_04060 [Candidatus Korarchaeota archaeon]
MTVYPEAIEKAEEASRNLKGFRSERELSDWLEIERDSIKQIPIDILANSIRSRTAREFFHKGYVACIRGRDNIVGSQSEK